MKTVDRNYKSHGGFQWPKKIGARVVAPDWNEQPVCGGGLHGLLWGCGDGSLLDWNTEAIGVVFSATGNVVDINNKVKVRSGKVEYIGSIQQCAQYIYDHGGLGMPIVGLCFNGGDGSTLTGGDRSTLTGGYGSTLTGGNGSTLTGGNGSTLTGRDESTLTGGEKSILQIKYYDGIRYRIVTGYIGEDGLLPGVPYRLDGNRKFEKAI
jgi:hypothetical protein